MVVASADSKERTRKAAGKYDFPFSFVCDDQGMLMDATRLRHSGQGPGGADVFYVTQFLIDEKGQVVWSFVPKKVNIRATPEQIIQAAQRALGRE